jgi:hypothetical protein
MWESVKIWTTDVFTDFWEIFIDLFVEIGLWLLTPIASMVSGMSSLFDSLGLASIFNLQGLPLEFLQMFSRLGLGQCMAIVGTALVVRVILQSIPFVRWGG